MGHVQFNRFHGTGFQIGNTIGRSVKDTLKGNIAKFIDIADEVYGIDQERFQANAVTWLNKLPQEYLEEVEGLAKGACCPVEMIARWIYCDRFIDNGCVCNGSNGNHVEQGCTSFIYLHEGSAWVGRNNDYIAPGMWSHVNIISKNGCIPVMLFGLEGGLFSGTGYNREKLWIHYNWLPVGNVPEKSIPPFVFLRMALEKCRTISEIEMLLRNTVRDGGMNLFVVDGKDNSFAVFECICTDYAKRESREKTESGGNKESCGRYIAGANHYNTAIVRHDSSLNSQSDFTDSKHRQAAVENMLYDASFIKAPDYFIKVLSSPDVERVNGAAGMSGTVYSNIVCPAADKLWYACNGFPAASGSDWEQLPIIW